MGEGWGGLGIGVLILTNDLIPLRFVIVLYMIIIIKIEYKHGPIRLP